MDCPACTRIARIRAGNCPWFIRELRESYCIAHDHQAYRGWCVLLLKEHAEHLHELHPDRQARIALDVADAAAAVVRAFAPRRINYECLGNVMPHVHWHIIPRSLPPDDPDPRATVWVQPAERLSRPCSEPERDAVVLALREAASAAT